MKHFFIPPTPRIFFEHIKSTDFELMCSFRKNHELMERLDKEIDTDEKIYWLLDNMYPNKITPITIWFAIYLTNSRQLIGNFGLFYNEKKQIEIGYSLFKEFRNLGYITEALPKLIDYCFNTLNSNFIVASISPHNVASSKTLLKFGFNFIEKQEKNYPYKGELLDTHIYKLTNQLNVPRETII